MIPGDGFIMIHGASALEVRVIKSEQELEKQKERGITLIDFCAPWYAPCSLQEPIIQQLAVEFQENALIGSMNIDESRDVAMRLGIQSIPTLIIFKNGIEIQRFVGLQPESVLSEALRELLA
jgi:thioredoxin 1